MAEFVLISSSTVAAGQVTISAFRKFMDFFRAEQSVKYEVTGPNYRKKTILFFYSYEEGERFTFEIRGKPAFVEAVLAILRCSDLRLRSGEIVTAKQLPARLAGPSHQLQPITPESQDPSELEQAGPKESRATNSPNQNQQGEMAPG